MWKEYVDSNTGYTYYWNTETNEVTWDKPAEVKKERSSSPNRHQDRRQPSKQTKDYAEKSKTVTERSRAKNSRSSGNLPKRGAPTNEKSSSIPSARSLTLDRASKIEAKQLKKRKPDKAPVVYGPSLPDPKPEEIAQEKIRKLEEEMSTKVLARIQSELPLDWKDTMPRALHTNPFRWDRKIPLLPVWNELIERENRPNSIALIAGHYGDSDDENDGTEDVNGVNGSRSKSKLQMHIASSHRGKIAKVQRAALFGEEKAARKEKSRRVSPGSDDLQAAEKRDRHGRKVYKSSSGQGPLL